MYVVQNRQMEMLSMSLNQAFAQRVRQLLKEKKMTMYRLEQDTG